MLRVKLSKLKQVCATALLPRIFKETKFLKNKIDKCSVEYVGKIRKSTDSGSKDEEYEKQMRIIEKCFPEKTTVIDIKNQNDETKELSKESHIEGDKNDGQKALRSKGFEYEKIANLKNTGKLMQDGYVESTTAKIEEEKLTQKIDNIDETPHVEAGVGKVEGFNVTPRVLGHDKNILDGSAVKHTVSIEQEEQINLDELAKRCLSSPAGDIDNILLNELKNISRGHSEKMNVNLLNDSAQKYYSQAFENSTATSRLVSDISKTHFEQTPNKDEKDIENKEMTERFQPFQLDTIPVFPIDVNGMRYKQNEFATGYSPVGNNVLLDIPTVLEPYNMQAIPFYEYVNKENIILHEIPSIEEAAMAETIQETDVKTPMNEEVILQRNLNEEENLTDKEAKELEETESAELNPMITKTIEPSVKGIETQKLSDADVTKLLEYQNVISTSLDVPEKGNITSEKVSQSQLDQTCVLTSTTDETSNLDGSFQNESSNSAISNAYPATNTRRSLELPENTAISANQKPEEYFELPKDNFQSIEESLNHAPKPIVNDSRVTNLTFTDILYSNIKVSDTEVVDETFTDTIVSAPKVFDTRNPENKVTSIITSDNPETQNLGYPTTPDFLEVEEDKRGKVNSGTDDINRFDYHDGPITHLLFQPELKQQEDFKTECTNNDTALSSEDTIPLSMLLKQVRERNRVEFKRAVFLKSGPKPEAKKVTCVPPLDRSKPKTNLSPNPCQPKPKSPCKPKCPQPCPPKKDPCAKFTPFFLHTIFKSDSSLDSSFLRQINQMYAFIASFFVTISKFQEMSNFLGFLSIKRNVKANPDNVVCVRDFDPWVPIPSWPIPKVEKKRPLVCPKDGCKLPVRPIPSSTDKPCGMPKKISPSKIFFTPFVFDGNNGSF